MEDTRIRSVNDLSMKLENLDPEQVKTIHQRRQQLGSRPVPEREAVGLGEGAGVHLRLSLTPFLPDGRVSMATYSGTSSSWKGPWRHTRCPKSWMTSPSGLRRK